MFRVERVEQPTSLGDVLAIRTQPHGRRGAAQPKAPGEQVERTTLAPSAGEPHRVETGPNRQFGVVERFPHHRQQDAGIGVVCDGTDPLDFHPEAEAHPRPAHLDRAPDARVRGVLEAEEGPLTAEEEQAPGTHLAETDPAWRSGVSHGAWSNLFPPLPCREESAPRSVLHLLDRGWRPLRTRCVQIEADRAGRNVLRLQRRLVAEDLCGEERLRRHQFVERRPCLGSFQRSAQSSTPISGPPPISERDGDRSDEDEAAERREDELLHPKN